MLRHAGEERIDALLFKCGEYGRSRVHGLPERNIAKNCCLSRTLGPEERSDVYTRQLRRLAYTRNSTGRLPPFAFEPRTLSLKRNRSGTMLSWTELVPCGHWTM
eukprot:4526424-Pleurochrysis_carterae.AAC.2